jgi:hypothetical protein
MSFEKQKRHSQLDDVRGDLIEGQRDRMRHVLGAIGIEPKFVEGSARAWIDGFQIIGYLDKEAARYRTNGRVYGWRVWWQDEDGEYVPMGYTFYGRSVPHTFNNLFALPKLFKSNRTEIARTLTIAIDEARAEREAILKYRANGGTTTRYSE